MAKEYVSIFDLLREQGVIKDKTVLNEADDDNDAAETAGETQQTATDSEDAGTAADDDAAGDAPTDDAGGDDNFDIDASLGDDTGSDDSGSSDDLGGSSDSGENTSNSGSKEEVNKYNTNMFAMLSAEEQKIKMVEQKKLFQGMYDSITEILNRINDFDMDETNMAVLSRLSNILFDLKKYIADYIIYDIPIKSYYDNEVMYNRFLLVINSITNVVDKFDKKLEKEEEN